MRFFDQTIFLWKRQAMIAPVDAAMLLNSPVRRGQQIILMAGLPTGEQVPVNFILLHTIGRQR